MRDLTGRDKRPDVLRRREIAVVKVGWHEHVAQRREVRTHDPPGGGAVVDDCRRTNRRPRIIGPEARQRGAAVGPSRTLAGAVGGAVPVLPGGLVGEDGADERELLWQ